MAIAAIELTKAAFEALTREARSHLENSISERVHARKIGKPEYAEKMEKRILECVDILGEVNSAKLGWGLEDPRVPATSRNAKRHSPFGPGTLRGPEGGGFELLRPPAVGAGPQLSSLRGT
jgi:hypothetical protein